MRVVFMGTPAFAVPVLEALLDAHDVALVVSQPDRPAGRGMSLRASEVAEVARARGVPLAQPDRARDPELLERVSDTGAGALIVAAYGQILPEALLGATPHGGINVHASLLPRWRGASPIAAAILAGDEVTGVSIMRMEAGMDTGPVLLQASTPILEDETAGQLSERLAGLGATALLEALRPLEAGTATSTPQDDALVTYAPLVRKRDGDLGWELPALTLERAVRAYDPWPGVRLEVGGMTVRVLEARALPAWTAGAAGADRPAPGSILESSPRGLTVMAADAPLLVARVQPPGRRPMAAADYARGRRLEAATQA